MELERGTESAVLSAGAGAGNQFLRHRECLFAGLSEEPLGRFREANAKREDTVIATKLNGVMRDGLSRLHHVM